MKHDALIMAADAARTRRHGHLILAAEALLPQARRLVGQPVARPTGPPCRWCGQTLQSPESIRLGAGPVCRARHEH